MKREYSIRYRKNQEEIQDLFNSIETILFIIISRMDRRIQDLKIIENDFVESESL